MTRSHLLRLLPLGLLLLTTQTGCATLITATACIASKAKHCGPAITAAATVDAVVLDAAASSSSSAACDVWVCDEYGDCFCND